MSSPVPLFPLPTVPEPTSVWTSSIKRMISPAMPVDRNYLGKGITPDYESAEKLQLPDFCISFINVVTRASNSPLSFAPAINNPISKDIMRFVCGENKKADQICKIRPSRRHERFESYLKKRYNHL